jgi:type IV pilus assembly protein PilX
MNPSTAKKWQMPLPRQQGVALVVALVLLVLVTLVGLAAIRGTTMQQKMASNLYDREIAFQNAEAAMRAAAATILSNAAVIGRNCGTGGVLCESNPFNDTNNPLPASKIITVPTGTGSGQFSASAVAAGQPQYVIENMGAFADPSSSTGFNQTANAAQYGAQGSSTSTIYYRITARSSDPTNVGDRAIVTLQAMVKQ